jgi:hypothetical protein
MHKTNTVDYAVVFEGEIWLELDERKTVHLKKGGEWYSARMAKPRNNAGDDVVFSKRSEKLSNAAFGLRSQAEKRSYSGSENILL